MRCSLCPVIILSAHAYKERHNLCMNRALLDCESLGRESSGETIQSRLLCKTAARTQKARKSTEKWESNGLK